MDIRSDRVSDLVPFVHVSDLPRSIAFYELLGLEIGDTYEARGQLQWVALQNAHARLMLQLASAPIDPQQQAVLFYLYVADLEALRNRLLARGVPVGPIRDGSPGPEREIAISDPDGYCLMIAEGAGKRAFTKGTAQAGQRGGGPRGGRVIQVVRSHDGGLAIGVPPR